MSVWGKNHWFLDLHRKCSTLQWKTNQCETGVLVSAFIYCIHLIYSLISTLSVVKLNSWLLFRIRFCDKYRNNYNNNWPRKKTKNARNKGQFTSDTHNRKYLEHKLMFIGPNVQKSNSYHLKSNNGHCLLIIMVHNIATKISKQ